MSPMAGLATKTPNLRPHLRNRSLSLNLRQATTKTTPLQVSKRPAERHRGGVSSIMVRTAVHGLVQTFDSKGFQSTVSIEDVVLDLV